MQLPTAYCDHVKFAPAHATLYLEKYGHALTWNKNKKEVVADIGCANGEITTEILLPFCKDNVEAMIGIDNSKDMLRRANERNKEPRVSFVEMDVVGKDIDPNMVEKFDRIFSFYCIHLINDQRQCAENFYKMLKPGGQIFLTFTFKNSMLESCFTMCNYEKWARYIEHFPTTMSSYFICEKPRDDFEKVFRDAGFSVESYEVEPVPGVIGDLTQFKDFVGEVNVLLNSIPENRQEEFLNEHVEYLSTLCKNGDLYEVHVKAVVAILRKPII